MSNGTDFSDSANLDTKVAFQVLGLRQSKVRWLFASFRKGRRINCRQGSFNGKPKATFPPFLDETVAFGLSLNEVCVRSKVNDLCDKTW